MLALFVTLLPVAAHAACYGTGNLYNCNDPSGNSYNVQRYGNTTNTQGYNSGTGSSWSQNSTTVGNTTYHNGTAANGNSWSGTTSTYGGVTTRQGVDSRGNVYSKTCTAYGCN